MRLCFMAAANSIHSYRWIKYFAEVGHEVTWISLAPNIFDPLPGVRCFEVESSGRGRGILLGALKARKIFAKARPDVLHVHYVGAYGTMALLTGFRPLVATPWGSDVIYGKESPFKRPLIGWVLRRAAMVTCDAWHMRREVTRFGVPTDRIHIINFGVETDRFSPRTPSSAVRAGHGLGKAPAVISLRNFEPVYDLRTLVEAVPRILQHFPETRFVLVGRGSLESELKALANRLGIEDAVRFVGFVPNERLPDTLSSVDVYVSTSLSDAGIAASTAEAMACALPVVVTDSGENARWITSGENGFLVPVTQPEALAAAVCRLLGDAELRRRLGTAGRATIQARNDYRAEMAKMDLLYRGLVHTPTSSQ